MSKIVFPDVCKTPARTGPVPIPYPNIDQGKPNAAKATAKKVKVANADFDQHMQNLRAAGDADAGAAKGLVSAVNLQQKAIAHLHYSHNVKVESATMAVMIGMTLSNKTPSKPK